MQLNSIQKLLALVFLGCAATILLQRSNAQTENKDNSQSGRYQIVVSAGCGSLVNSCRVFRVDTVTGATSVWREYHVGSEGKKGIRWNYWEKVDEQASARDYTTSLEIGKSVPWE